MEELGLAEGAEVTALIKASDVLLATESWRSADARRGDRTSGDLTTHIVANSPLVEPGAAPDTLLPLHAGSTAVGR